MSEICGERELSANVGFDETAYNICNMLSISFHFRVLKGRCVMYGA